MYLFFLCLVCDLLSQVICRYARAPSQPQHWSAMMATIPDDANHLRAQVMPHQCLQASTGKCVIFLLPLPWWQPAQLRLWMMTMAMPCPRSIFTIHDVWSSCLASTTTPSGVVAMTYHNIQPHCVDACMLALADPPFPAFPGTTPGLATFSPSSITWQWHPKPYTMPMAIYSLSLAWWWSQWWLFPAKAMTSSPSPVWQWWWSAHFHSS